MKHSIESTWKEGMKFDTEVNGHHFMIDSAEKFGGEDAGRQVAPAQ